MADKTSVNLDDTNLVPVGPPIGERHKKPRAGGDTLREQLELDF